MVTASGKGTDEAQIRELIEGRVKAVHAKDINAAMFNVAPDILSFGVVNPLQLRGSETVRDRAQAWFSAYPGPIGFEIRDVSITAGSDVAFSHYFYRVSGTMKNGAKVDMWVRATACYRKVDGKWLVVHEHESVPFDTESGKASVNLKP